MRRWKVAAAAAVVVLGLGGCAQSPSTAAVVDGQKISVSDVEDTTHVLKQQGFRVPSGMVLSIRMRAVAAEHIAARQGVRLEQDASALADQLGLPPQLNQTPQGSQLANGIAEVEALRLRLGDGPMNAALGAIPVQVNPRFGVRGLEDVASGTAALGNGSLSQPAAE